MKAHRLPFVRKPSPLLALIVLSALGMNKTSLAQTGAYSLNGGQATLASFATNATTADESGVFVYGSGILEVGTLDITTSGNASDADAAGKYGINAGVLAGTTSTKGTILITGASNRVVTSGSVANGLFATHSGSSITMLGGIISATGANAHGIDVTYGGSITLSNVDVTTWGGSSSAIATDFGGGTVSVFGGTIIASNTTAGSHSAGIYSTGTITVRDAQVTSMADCGGVIDGANSIILTNTVLKGALEGVKMWKTAPASGSAVVTMNGGSMTALGGNCFYVTGTTGNAATGTINVMNGATLSASTGNLFKVDGSSTAYFTASEEVLSGNFDTDSASTLSAALFNHSVLTGAVNTAGTGSDNLTLDATSTWNITADSFLNKLTNAGTINGPGTLNASDVLLQGGSIAATLAGTGVLRKTTSATAILSGINTYTGATTVNEGTLLVNGSLGNSPVTVNNGVLGGDGSIGGIVTINSGGTVAPGSSTLGTLTMQNSLKLTNGSILAMKLNALGLESDRIEVTGTMTLAGSLIVTNLSGDLKRGSSFTLLKAGSFSGAFTSITLPLLPTGLEWDTSLLATDGTIQITSPAPSINTPVLTGGEVVLTGGSGKTGTLYVLATTNVALPLSEWVRVSTNQVQANGHLTVTNQVDPGVPQMYFMLELR